jgi:hypothetical protein
MKYKKTSPHPLQKDISSVLFLHPKNHDSMQMTMSHPFGTELFRL